MTHALAHLVVSIVFAVAFVVLIVGGLLWSQWRETALKPTPPRACGPKSSRQRVG